MASPKSEKQQQRTSASNDRRQRTILWIAVVGSMAVIVTGWVFLQVGRFRVGSNAEPFWATESFGQVQEELSSAFQDFQEVFSPDAQAQSTYTEEQQQLQDEVFPQFVTEE